MLSTEREDFDKLLAELFAGLDKPLTDARRNALWKALANMSLVDFHRTVDAMLQEMAADGDKAREWGARLTPSDIWGAKRRLRARGAPAAKQPEEKSWTGDHWDIFANLVLLGYIDDQARLGVHYCCEETRQGRRRATNPSEESKELTACLVAYKHAWAADMRETGKIPTDFPKAELMRTFMDCMRRASADAEQVREAYAAEHREQEWAA